MSNKIETLKKMRRVLVGGLCIPIILTGCGSNKDTNKTEIEETKNYVIILNDNNALIFEEVGYDLYSNNDVLHIDYPGGRIVANGEPYIIIETSDKNGKKEAYEAAKSLVGEDGTVTFYQENILKRKKTQ